METFDEVFDFNKQRLFDYEIIIPYVILPSYLVSVKELLTRVYFFFLQRIQLNLDVIRPQS